MGRYLCRHSAVNIHRYGNVIMPIRLVLDREIQGLYFDAWFAV